MPVAFGTAHETPHRVPPHARYSGGCTAPVAEPARPATLAEATKSTACQLEITLEDGERKVPFGSYACHPRTVYGGQHVGGQNHVLRAGAEGDHEAAMVRSLFLVTGVSEQQDRGLGGAFLVPPGEPDHFLERPSQRVPYGTWTEISRSVWPDAQPWRVLVRVVRS